MSHAVKNKPQNHTGAPRSRHGHFAKHHRPAHHDTAAAHESATDRKSWLMLALLAVAQFMVILDVTVVNVALPSIGSALDFRFADLHWVISAYVLFTGGLMLLGGRLSDTVGRRPVFMTGLAIFTVGSLASGLAWSPAALIAARAVQGVGAALLLPSGLSILTTYYEGHQRAVALAIWGALGAGGAAAGVLIGGVLTSALSWHWIFFVNVPIGVVLAVIAMHKLPTQPAEQQQRSLDIPGAVTLMSGLGALILAAQASTNNGWLSSETALRAGIAVALLGIFVLIESRSAQPLVPPVTWRVRSLTSGAAMILIATGLLVGTFFVNTLYLQTVLDASPIETGLAFLPLTLMIVVGAHAASSVMPRVGTRLPLAGGMLLTALGSYLLSRASIDAGYFADVLPGFLIFGFGVGLSFVAISVAAMADVKDDFAGLASGMISTSHELGAAIGVAVFASIAAAGNLGLSAASLVDGRSDALTAAAVLGVIAAVASVKLVPSTQPKAGEGHSLH